MYGIKYLFMYLTVHIDQLGPRAIFSKRVQLHKYIVPFYSISPQARYWWLRPLNGSRGEFHGQLTRGVPTLYQNTAPPQPVPARDQTPRAAVHRKRVQYCVPPRAEKSRDLLTPQASPRLQRNVRLWLEVDKAEDHRRLQDWFPSRSILSDHWTVLRELCMRRESG